MVSTPGLPASFRQRAKVSDRATRLSALNRKARVAANTLQALDRFEDNLASLEFKVYDELDEAAKGVRSRMDVPSRSKSETALSREFRDTAVAASDQLAFAGAATAASASMSHLVNCGVRAVSRERDFDAHAKRPPSPLGLYDYGCISLKPRSKFGQDRVRAGASTRSEHRSSTSCGFYFPGPSFDPGPYGFSIADPVLLASRNAPPREPAPERWRGDPGDVRPLASQALLARGPQADKPVTSPKVQSTTAHVARARLAFNHIDKRREEALLEQMQFENGVYEGRWRDPVLDMKGEIPKASPPLEYAWVFSPVSAFSAEQAVALRILYGIGAVLRSSLGRFSDLFAAENSGPHGVLETSEFLRGLLRLGVLQEGEVSEEEMRKIAPVLDPTGHGRVHIPVVARAVAILRGTQPPEELLGTQAMKKWRKRHPAPPPAVEPAYGDAAPVDYVKLDYSAGLFNFSKSMEKFRAQQRSLLTHHAELP